MTSEHSQIEALLNWLQSFNFSQLQNEDDVETKFVIKFLEYFGYTDQYRRGKFPIKTYQPGKRGRDPEIDNVFFSTTDAEKQGSDTSLLLVEAKHPTEADLEKDVPQAEFYVDKVKALLHVLTNGYQFKVFKRHRHHDDERIFDEPTSALLNEETLARLYKLIQFDVIKALKEEAVNDITHDLYVEISQTLHYHPDLLAQLEKGDFNSYDVHEERHIVVSRPRVAVNCQLPLVYVGGNCQIEFSNVMLRGLTCQLSHDDILRNLLIGLHTPPDWEARRFIKKTTDGTFEASLGHATVLLSERETQELCACVDIVGQAYKEALIEATELLKAWKYQYIQTFEMPGFPNLIRGFSLLSVKPWLWRLMKQFARDFDYLHGKSDWHIFDHGNHSISIHTNKQGPANVTLWPLIDSSNLASDWVDILYYNPDENVGSYEYDSEKLWKHFVGVQGIWTVQHTHKWIIKRFIPKVLSHYHVQYEGNQSLHHIVQEWLVEKLVSRVFSGYKVLHQKKRMAQQKMIINSSTTNRLEETDLPLPEASKLWHLAPYLHDIQSWLAFYSLAYQTQKIAASLLRPYYMAFADVLKAIDATKVNISYIREKLGCIEREKRRELREEGEISEEEAQSIYEDLSTIEGIIECLDSYVSRIREIEYESTDFAELISRVFISLAEIQEVYIKQDLFNEAKQALLPLWQQSRFDERFIQ